MARISKHERENKINHAKRLYIKGFDFITIADMLNITVSTLQRWAKDNDFEQAKRAASISISEIRNEILNTYEAMKKGETPDISPDQISKLVASFEKLSSSQKSLTWIIEAFEMLTDSFLGEIQETKNEKQKAAKYNILKQVRQHCDRVVMNLQKQLL